MSTLVIMLSGKQGSGKTTTARALKELWQKEGIPVLTYKLAQPLYEMHDVLYRVAEDYGITLPPGGKDKTLLQILGTEWGRNSRGKNIWIRCAQRKIDKMTAEMSAAGQFNVVLIDDLRFKNELQEMNALKIRLECDRDRRYRRCDCWRDNEHHSSEIDLDDCLDKFDLVVDSGRDDVGEVVNQIAAHCRKSFPAKYQDAEQSTVASNTIRIPRPTEMVPNCR